MLRTATAVLSLLGTSVQRTATLALVGAATLAVAPALHAQTETYYAVLSGANEVPPNASTGKGEATITVNSTTFAFTVTGTFSGLSSAATAAHIHAASAGVNGAVLYPLTATNATSGALTGSGTLSPAEYSMLTAGGLYVNLHTANNPGGELRDQLRAVGVDGNCSESRYNALASATGAQDGFGGTNDLRSLKYYADGQDIYVCMSGQIENTSNGFALFFNFSNYDGIDGGAALPAGGPGFFGNIAGTKLDTGFDTDWILFANRSGTSVYTNIARLGSSSFVANPNGDYLGATPDNGTGTGNGNVVSETGTGTVSMAYQTGFDATTAPDKGYEIRLPISAFAGVSPVAVKGNDRPAAQGVLANDIVSLFAIIVSNTGYFSNEMLPDAGLNGTGGAAPNFGNTPDFAAASPGVDLFTTPQALPVELVAFAATANGTSARLAWTTASETNNAGFAVEQQTGTGSNTVWTERGFVAGRGTTTERSDYTFEVSGLTAGTHAFRLRQTDTDGTVHYSPVVTVEVGVDGNSRVTLLGQRAVRVETNEAQSVSVRVFDVLGRAVVQTRVDVDGTTEVALPQGLAAGAYVVRVEGERFAETRTLVVH